MNELRRKFGMLFQGAALFDSLPVWENVAFGLLATKRVSRLEARARAERTLAMVGLAPEVAGLMPSELSGGMQKRVGLARAIAHEPEILFFDEPTTGLDPIMADVINELIVRCVKQLGATALSITHDMASVRKIADRVAMLYGGRIVWQGPVDHDRRQRQPVRRPVHPWPRRRPDPGRRRHDLGLMARPQRAFVCQSCGAAHARWAGRCDDCGAWNSIVEEATASPAAAAGGKARGRRLDLVPLEGSAAPPPRVASGIDELDRVLGGGIVPGAAMLIGGDPGIGKSTLMLQAAAAIARHRLRGGLCQRRGIGRPDPAAGRCGWAWKRPRCSSPAPPRSATSWRRSTSPGARRC